MKTSKMSDRRRWKDLEIDALVDFVEVHYDYLTSAYNASKTKKDVEEKWQECAKAINYLGKGPALKWLQVRKK